MLKNAVGRTAVKAATQGSLGGPSGSADGPHPNLGLHSAAASGNIGLVKFALENGQSANSNFNGIFPLHAACSGGSEPTVRMLIYHGADVNVARLKSKASTGPGAEGSTPLHFAAANGHLDIVRVLLEAGARPAALDKEGVVPEELAFQNNHEACASLIRSWISAYGSNGLAGMVSSRDTVSGDVALGPAGYIRYAGASSSAQPHAASASYATSESIDRSATSTPSHHYQGQSPSDALASKPRSQRSGTSSSNPISVSRESSHRGATPNYALPSSPTPSSASSVRPVLVTSPVSSTSALTRSEMTTPLDIKEDTEASSAFNLSSADMAPPSTSIAPTQLRDTKRRPSMPSIMEKAAHPAATIRAALMNGGVLTPQPFPMHRADSSQSGTLSPSKKPLRLAGKRSLSNILRKVTGSSEQTTPSHAAASASASASDLSSSNASARGTSLTGKSLDFQRDPLLLSAQHHSRSTDGINAEASKPLTAPSHQTSFALSQSQWTFSNPSTQADPARLRSGSSSSTGSAYQSVEGGLQRVGKASSMPSDNAAHAVGIGRSDGPPLTDGDMLSNDDGASRHQHHSIRTRSESGSSSTGNGARRRLASLSSQDRPRDAEDLLEYLAEASITARHNKSFSDLQTQGGATEEISSATFTARQARTNSGSSVSAISTGSTSANAVDQLFRGSSSLTPMYRTPSATDGQISPDTPVSQPSQDNADSADSRRNLSPLRTNSLSAAEQASAILSQDVPFALDGPDGTSMSLAAQLAAYGEALASERKGAGESRIGPSPNLSTRGSNSNLRPKLPSVSEDWSPGKPNLRDAVGVRGTVPKEDRVLNYPATAAQSYNRRLSRRPASSDGPESQGSFRSSSTVRGLSPGDGSVRLASATDTSKQIGLRSVFLDAPRGSGSGSPSQMQNNAEWVGRKTASSASPSPRGVSPLTVPPTDSPKESTDSPPVPKKDVSSPRVAEIRHEASDAESSHRFSPSLPTELASYTTSKQERAAPASPLVSSNSTGLTTPSLPPRKGSISPHDSNRPSLTVTRSSTSSRTPSNVEDQADSRPSEVHDSDSVASGKRSLVRNLLSSKKSPSS